MNRRPSASLVVSIVALIVASAGTGYAAFRLPANSVGTQQLRNGAVTAQKVRRHSLLAADFKPGQLPAGGSRTPGNGGPAGAPGSSGAPGQAGGRGPAGPPGPPGTARAYGLVVVSGPGAAPTLARSHNVARVIQPSPGGVTLNGVYCITPAAGIDPASTTIVATPDEYGAGTSREIAHVDSSAADCPDRTGSFEVETRHVEYVSATSSSPPTVAAHHGDSGFSFVIP